MAPSARPRAALLGGALVVLGAAGAVLLSGPGIAYQARLAQRPLMKAMGASSRMAKTPPSFVMHVDPAGRFTVSIPDDFRVEIDDPSFLQLRGPAMGGLPAYLTFEVEKIEGPVTDDLLAKLDRKNEEQMRKSSQLTYQFLARKAGDLDGRPALSRTFALGDYEGWQVSTIDGPWHLALTILCHGSAFESRRPLFATVLKTFRFASEA